MAESQSQNVNIRAFIHDIDGIRTQSQNMNHDHIDTTALPIVFILDGFPLSHQSIMGTNHIRQML